MAKSSDIIKIGFDYRASLEQFEKETNGVFDGISEKAGKQRISIQLDAKNDKVIEKIKELQKLKLDKFTFEFGESGLAEQLKTFDQLEKKINEIINLSKGINNIGSGNGIGNSIVNEKSLNSIIDLFGKMESHLGEMKKVFADVGDGEEFSPLLKMINDVRESVGKLSSSAKNIGLNMNIDVGSNKELETRFQEKASKALIAYQRLFDHIKSTTTSQSIFEEFNKFNLDNFDTTYGKAKAIANFIERARNDSKTLYNEHDVLKEDTLSTYWNQASASMAQATKVLNEMRASSNVNPLENLFGKTDLTEVVTQLNRIVEKLSEISSTASEFKNAFANGFNVSASVEEIEKLTSRVKELENELSKVKVSSASPVKTNISSPIKDTFQGDKTSESLDKVQTKLVEVRQETEKTASTLEGLFKGRDIVSQVDIKALASNGAEYTEMISFIERLQDGQLRRATATWDEDMQKWKETTLTVSTAFEKVGNEIISLDNQINKLESDMNKTKQLYPTYDTSADEKLIALAERRRDSLLEILSTYSSEKEYIYEISAFEQRRLENAERLKNITKKQENLSDAKQGEKFQKDFNKAYEEAVQINKALNETKSKVDGLSKHSALSTQFAEVETTIKSLNTQLTQGEISVSEYNKAVKETTSNYSKLVSIQQKRDTETYNANTKQAEKEAKELLATQQQITKEAEKQTEAQQKKWQAFHKEQQDYVGQKQESDAIERNKSAYQELLDTIKQYSEVSKRIAKNETLDGDLELAQKLENKISELQKNPILSSSQVAKSERGLVNLYDQLETLEKKTAQKQNNQASAQVAKEHTEAWEKNLKAIQEYMDANTKLNKLMAKDKGTGKHASDIARQEKEVEKLKESAIEAKVALSSMVNPHEAPIDDWNKWIEAMEKFEQATKGSVESVAKLEDALRSARNAQLSSIDSTINNSQSKLDDFSARKAQSNAYKNSLIELGETIERLRTLRASLSNTRAFTDEEKKQIDALTQSVRGNIKEIQRMSAGEKGSDALSRDKWANRIQEYMDKNTRLTREFREELENLIRILRTGGDSVVLKDVIGQFEDAKFRIKEAKLEGKSFFDIFKDKAVYGFAAKLANYYLSFYDFIRYGRYAINALVELDSALLDLKKTTTMTGSQLDDFYYTSNDVAKQMGVTTTQIIEQASAWSRLGYSSQEAATKMAQLSSQFASISPGMETDQAQEGLVSIMKAWDIDTDEVESEIMDNINILGNSFAESNADIVEGMKRSAAALSAVGTEYEDAFALFTGAQEILQNAEVTGRALRSISMRVRGYSESSEDGFEELDDELKNITGDLIDLTKTAEHSQGVSIFKDGSTTEFKSLVEYFGEISEIWDEMTQVQQNDFLQKAFGKTQAQAGAALIKNFEAVRDSLEVMEKSAGSADREMSIVQETLEYKINALKQTWVGTVQEMIERGDLGVIIDSLTKFSEAIGKVAGIVGLGDALGLGLGAFLGIKNIGREKCYPSSNMPIVI